MIYLLNCSGGRLPGEEVTRRRCRGGVVASLSHAYQGCLDIRQWFVAADSYLKPGLSGMRLNLDLVDRLYGVLDILNAGQWVGLSNTVPCIQVHGSNDRCQYCNDPLSMAEISPDL